MLLKIKHQEFTGALLAFIFSFGICLSLFSQSDNFRFPSERDRLSNAVALTQEFQKALSQSGFENIEKILVRYTVLAEARGVTIEIPASLSLAADSRRPSGYQATLTLSSLSGKSAFDDILISLGKIVGKVPNVQTRVMMDLEYEETGLLRTLTYWEFPKPKSRKSWENILRLRKKSEEARSSHPGSRKLSEMELNLRLAEDYFWSPFLVEFALSSDNVIRLKKNNLDEQSGWDERTIPYTGQTDPLTALLNYTLLEKDSEQVLSTINVYRKGEKEEGKKKRPKYIFTGLKLPIVTLTERETNLHPFCTSKIHVAEGENLMNLIHQPVYFRTETVPGNGQNTKLGRNLASYIYVGDITDITEGKEKIVCRKVRIYLIEASVFPKSTSSSAEGS